MVTVVVAMMAVLLMVVVMGDVSAGAALLLAGTISGGAVPALSWLETHSRLHSVSG